MNTITVMNTNAPISIAERTVTKSILFSPVPGTSVDFESDFSSLFLSLFSPPVSETVIV